MGNCSRDIHIFLLTFFSERLLRTVVEAVFFRMLYHEVQTGDNRIVPLIIIMYLYSTNSMLKSCSNALHCQD